MGKKRKDAPLVPPPIASRRVARRVTSEFHRLAQDAARAPTAAARAAAERVLEARRGRYQEASALSTALHSTSRWVLRVLRRRGVLGAAANARPPALLEVGAVNTQLLEARGLAVRAIDVRSSMQRIERVDFFDLRPQGSYLRGNQPVSYVTTRPRGQRRVDGVESPRHRADGATEARRVDAWYARNVIPHSPRQRASLTGGGRLSKRRRGLSGAACCATATTSQHRERILLRGFEFLVFKL